MRIDNVFLILVMIGNFCLAINSYANGEKMQMRAANKPKHLNISGDLYAGAAIPEGTETVSGAVMGGRSTVSWQPGAGSILVYGELLGEGFNNSSTGQDIKFSQFYFNSALMVGPANAKWKWKTPANIAMSRDTIVNESFSVRYAFSGLYIRFLNSEDDGNKDKLKQVLEAVADVVVSNSSYMTGWQYNYDVPVEPCVKEEPCEVPAPTREVVASHHSFFGLYSSIKYEIERRGWGSVMQVEALKDISPSYTKVSARIIGYKQLEGDFKQLRPYIELDGLFDRDTMDPSSEFQGSLRIVGGIGGRFGF